MGDGFGSNALFSHTSLSSVFRIAGHLQGTCLRLWTQNRQYQSCQVHGKSIVLHISSIQPPNPITTLLLPNLLPSDPAIPFALLRWTRYSSSYVLTTRIQTSLGPPFPSFARPRTPGGDVRSCFLSSCLHGGLRSCEVGSVSCEALCWRSILGR